MMTEKKFKALLVDDEPLARRNLRVLLNSDAQIEVVKECGDGADAVASIRALAPDLVFLDVQMPELDGFAVLDQLAGTPLPLIIFVTAYDQYALRAFEVSALDYLLKPFSDERFRKALQQAKQQLAQQDASALGQKLLALLDAHAVETPRYLTRLMVKTTGRVFFLRVEELDWIEAYDNYVRLHAGGKTHLLRQTMNELEVRLDPTQFARIHRSALVKLDRVKELHPQPSGEHTVILHDGTELKLSRGRREWLEQRLATGAA